MKINIYEDTTYLHYLCRYVSFLYTKVFIGILMILEMQQEIVYLL